MLRGNRLYNFFVMSSTWSRAAGDACSFRHGLELRPHDRWMHTPVDFFLREAAVGAGNQVLAADARGESRETLGDKLRMFHHVRAVADDARHENLAGRQLHLLPHLPFV